MAQFVPPNVPQAPTKTEAFLGPINQAVSVLPSLILQWNEYARKRQADEIEHEIKMRELRSKYGGSASVGGLPGVSPTGQEAASMTPENKLAAFGTEGVAALRPPTQYAIVGPGGTQTPMAPGVKPFSAPSERFAGMTPGESALDKTFAKTYEEWTASGGYASAEKNLQALSDVAASLKTGKGNASGPVTGLIPDKLKPILGQSEALDKKDLIAGVVQQNLRQILGGQFAEREGENLVRRAYNESLDEKTNAKRLDRLFKEMKAQADAKEKAAKYFEEHGTLKGFKGTLFTSPSDFLKPEVKAVGRFQVTVEE